VNDLAMAGAGFAADAVVALDDEHSSWPAGRQSRCNREADDACANNDRVVDYGVSWLRSGSNSAAHWISGKRASRGA